MGHYNFLGQFLVHIRLEYFSCMKILAHCTHLCNNFSFFCFLSEFLILQGHGNVLSTWTTYESG